MNRKGSEDPRQSRRDFSAQVADFYADLNEESAAQRHEDWLCGRIQEMGVCLNELPSSLQNLVTRWPQHLKTRLLQEETWVGNGAAYPLAKTYRAAMNEFVNLVRTGGFLSAYLHVLELDIQGAAAPFHSTYDMLTHWTPSIGWSLFGDGTILQPWLVEAAGTQGAVGRAVAVCHLAQPPHLSSATIPWLSRLLTDEEVDVRFNAAVCLSQLAPDTPGLAEIVLSRLIQNESMAKSFWLERDYPPYSRKHMPAPGHMAARAALELLPLSAAASTLRGGSIFRHAVDRLMHACPELSSDFPDLVRALDNEDQTLRRTAALAIFFYPEEKPAAPVGLDRLSIHEDRYVEILVLGLRADQN